MSYGSSTPEGYSADLGIRIRAAVASVKDEIRHAPQDEAEARMVEALGADAWVFSPLALTRLVRHVKDPLWSVKHPIRSWRELRGN